MHLSVVIVGEDIGWQAGWQYVSLKLNPKSLLNLILKINNTFEVGKRVNAPLKLNVLWFAKTNHLKLELLTEPEDGEVIVDIVRVVARVLKNLAHSNLKTVMITDVLKKRSPTLRSPSWA